MNRIRIFLWTVLAALLIAVFFGLWHLPSIQSVQDGVWFVAKLAKGKNEKRFLSPKQKSFVRSSTLPRYVVGAILVSEDATFFQHSGLDWHELRLAAKKNMNEKRIVRGASTITQQLVKNAFLSPERTYARKIVEAITALRIEGVLSKEEILNYYLNLVEFGPGIYGIGEASRHYFNCAPTELDPVQAALLAFFIPSPKTYGPQFSTGKASEYREKRVQSILRNMVRQKYLVMENIVPEPSSQQEDSETEVLEEDETY